MHKKVLLLPGDGIGQEVVAAATEVMQAAAQQSGCNLEISEALIGGAAIDATGEPLPSATLAAAEQVDAVLLGGVGGPKWD
ncbi:MAG TPA: 3-isopropylmalate dehydrogenase, partial [Gammaproteobacteria bacterium]|nr:3-isopropylmalate dehydrogenase [Gammaproteobacteria bacterium]